MHIFTILPVFVRMTLQKSGIGQEPQNDELITSIRLRRILRFKEGLTELDQVS